MKTRLLIAGGLFLVLAVLLTAMVVAQEPASPARSTELSPTHASPSQASILATNLQAMQEASSSAVPSAETSTSWRKETLLLWPVSLAQFAQGYASWESWLPACRSDSLAVRDELLVAVRAVAAQVPLLKIGTDDPASDLIIVSGQPESLFEMVERLRDHPLVADISSDTAAARTKARMAWSSRGGAPASRQRTAPVAVNIRSPWATNVVWGRVAPNEAVTVTLTRNKSLVLTTTVAASDGLYHAYLPWEIRAGDVVDVAHGQLSERMTVSSMEFSTDFASKRLTVRLPESTGATERADSGIDMVIGESARHVGSREDGQFVAGFSGAVYSPGDPGFLRRSEADGARLFLPFKLPVVNIRRDLSRGQLPYGGSHAAGVSQIIWGSAAPNSTFTITLSRPGEFNITRSVQSDESGNFSVSMDRLIAGGDTVQVTDGTTTRTIQVPVLTYQADSASGIITGKAPANITDLTPNAPHSLQVAIAGTVRQLSTGASGEFVADFSASPYIAGLLGTMAYTTSDGDRVYAPIFVADPPARGKLSDWRADVILGQPDLGQITPNEVINNKLFHPIGVYVDRTVRPNHVFVYDGGNSRILGLSHLGHCAAGTRKGNECMANSDCPGSSCAIDPAKPAEIVLGQPSFDRSACNGDSAYQLFPDTVMASPATLCGLREEQMSILEGGSGATMATDAQGNLYVPDHFNNRVLKYDDPFTTDTVADEVWGQADFFGITCNRGIGYGTRTDNKSLCLAPPPGGGDVRAGVAVDAAGNLWVADNENHRILRFPFSIARGTASQEADLVLGQPDFWSRSAGSEPNQMRYPASVRIDSRGSVYVADSLNNRVLVFDTPLKNGMAASRWLPGGLQHPVGLALGPDGSVWVNDNGNRRIVSFPDGASVGTIIPNVEADAGLGVDADNNLIVTIAGSGREELLHFSAPSYNFDAEILQSERGEWNHTGPSGNAGNGALEVTAGQLIYADRERMLFWNTPWELMNHQPADGVVGVPDFNTRYSGPSMFGRMRADDKNRLWVLHGGTDIRGYNLPLKMGATPFVTITTPLKVLGGGIFTWTETLGLSGIDVQRECDCLWLSDSNNSRTFRIRDVSTQPTVDIVLGQKDISGTHCNQGRDPEEGIAQHPSRDSLCHPGALAFDRSGNLYVADHNLEFRGNWRLLEFDARLLPPSPASAVFGIPASRVFGRGGDFTAPNCLPREQDPMCGPWEPAFDSHGRMVIGFNGYLGPHFPMVYDNPLSNAFPSAALGDFHSMPLSARFDQFDNLYVPDHNRMRVLIYKRQPVQTFTIRGSVRTATGDPIAGVQVETIGYASSGLTDASGMYTLTGAITGTYTLVPSLPNYVFEPSSRQVVVAGDVVDQDFTGRHEQTDTYLPLVIRG